MKGVPRERWAETPTTQLLSRRGPVASPDVPIGEVLVAVAVYRVGARPVVKADSSKLLREITLDSLVALPGSARVA